MSQVEILLGKSPNTFRWDLRDLAKDKFEDAVIGAIQESLSTQRPSASCIPTPATRDRGRDLVIEANEPIELCGVPLHPNRQRRLRVFVEIKSRVSKTHSRLDEKSYARSLTQLNDEDYDYFVIITNATLTPRAVRQTADLLQARNVEFVVIDEARLFYFLETTAIGRRFLAGTDRPVVDSPTRFVAEAQIHRATVDDALDLTIDLWLRNYDTKLVATEVILRTEHGWTGSPANLRRLLESNRDATFRLRASTATPNHGEDVAVVFRIGDEIEAVARIPAKAIGFDFTPPLQGRDHHRVLGGIRKIVQKDEPFAFISVTGEAGTGKTRVVMDALQLSATQTRLVHRAVIDRVQPDRAIRDLCQRVERSLGRTIVQAETALGAGDLLRQLVKDVDHEFYSIVIVLEDLHHASDDVIDALKDLCSADRRSNAAPVTVIATGRNDFTFPNQAYFSLLDLVAGSTGLDAVHAFKILRLAPNEAAMLIRSIIDDIPKDALGRIQRISENIPFCIVQVIEHLLEAGIAELRRSNRVGIPNPFTFASRSDIPQSMAEIYAARITTLQQHPLGLDAWTLLCVASIYGQSIPEHVMSRAAGSSTTQEVVDLISARHFLKVSEDQTFEWWHENWLHVIRDRVAKDGAEASFAAKILDDPVMCLDFEGLQLARLHSVTGRHEQARIGYSTAVEAARRVRNLSAVEIDPQYFTHYPHVFNSLHATGGSSEDLVRVLLAEAYLGNHAISGLTGLRAIRSALQRLDGIALEKNLSEIARAQLTQLETHAVMSIGRIGLAEQRLLELAARVQIDETLSTAYDVKFDLYNRLQDTYRFRNHLNLAEAYGHLAEAAARQLGGPSLVVSRFDTALIYHYVDTDRCVREHEAALAFAAGKGVEQNIVCGQVGLLAAKLSLCWRQHDRIEPILNELLDLLKLSIRRPYAPMIARCYLLVAVCNYLLSSSDPERLDVAESYVEAGINAAVNYSSGFDIWQLYNMRAILAARRNEAPSRIERQFNAAIDDLRASSLLSFGSLDLCFENMIVASNFIRFLYRSAQKTQLREFIREISFYDNSERDFATLSKHIVESVEEYGVLLQRTALNAVIRDEVTGYCIAAPC